MCWKQPIIQITTQLHSVVRERINFFLSFFSKSWVVNYQQTSHFDLKRNFVMFVLKFKFALSLCEEKWTVVTFIIIQTKWFQIDSLTGSDTPIVRWNSRPASNKNNRESNHPARFSEIRSITRDKHIVSGPVCMLAWDTKMCNGKRLWCEASVCVRTLVVHLHAPVN